MRKHFWLGTIGLFLYCCFIFYLSSVPGSSIPLLPFPDKMLHFFLYLGFGLIFTYSLNNIKLDLSWVGTGFTTTFITAIYGLSDEIHQIFVPGRNFDVFDLLVNVIGGISGCLLILFLKKIGVKSFVD